MKNEINMGSSVVDFYMDGYDEGKNDDVVEIAPSLKAKRTKSAKEKVSARRKKAYFKAKNRQKTLQIHYTPSTECEAVINGMLRNHQLPMGETKCEHPCGSSIGNKKRIDVANQKMREAQLDTENNVVVLHHKPVHTNEHFELHGYVHDPA